MMENAWNLQPVTSKNTEKEIESLLRTYPFMRSERLATTAFGRPVTTLVVGNGPRKVIFSAAFHGNEWITTPILLTFAKQLGEAIVSGGEIAGRNGRELKEKVTIYMVPLVNPDGVDLVTGAVAADSPEYALATALSENYPSIPFPSGWKANLLGVDLNLQFPAGWAQAREIKFMQGFTRPGPRDYVGRAPLDQVESRAMEGYTQAIDPALVLALHAQGEEIYWQFEDVFVPGARQLGERLAQVSGYTLADTPYNSSFAGYKDWFIKMYRRPGYTIEVGRGENPLPIEQFPEIYRAVLPILVEAALG